MWGLDCKKTELCFTPIHLFPRIFSFFLLRYPRLFSLESASCQLSSVLDPILEKKRGCCVEADFPFPMLPWAQVDLMYFLANPHSYCQILPGQVHRPPWLVSCPPRGDAANARLVAENVFCWVLHRVLILPSRFCVCFACGDLERLKNDVATTATFSESISTGFLNFSILAILQMLIVFSTMSSMHIWL